MDPTPPICLQAQGLYRDIPDHAIAPTEQRRVDKESKELSLKWAFAKISHLQNAAAQEVQLIGVSKELQTTQTKAGIQDALLQAINAVDLRQTPFPQDPCHPHVCISLEALKPLAAVITKLQKTEAELQRRKLQKDFEQRFWVSIYGLLEMYGPARAQAFYDQLESDKTIQKCGLKIPVYRYSY